MNNPLLNGTVYSHQIDGWTVSWESKKTYRHWCHQVKDLTWRNLLVIMFNPGSLSGDGSNLSKDTTLRILREVGQAANQNTFIVNLFDYASPSPENLFNNWHLRDSDALIFYKLKSINLSSFILAYGDYENWGRQNQAIKERALLAQNAVSHLHEIALPKNNSGTPKHPMTWQRQKLKPYIAELLVANA
jgi:hypothetical protein